MLIDIQSLTIVLNFASLLRWLSLLNRFASPIIYNIVDLPRDVLDSIRVFSVILFALKSYLASEQQEYLYHSCETYLDWRQMSSR